MNRLRKSLDACLNDPTSRYFSLVNDTFAILTLVSIVCLVLETVHSLKPYHPILAALEITALAFFTLEYMARVYAAPQRRKYVFSFFGLIDLLAILPSFLHVANLTFLKSARVLRILRMLRMIRLAKLTYLMKKRKTNAEHAHSINIINVQIYFFTLFAAILIFGCLIYVFEAHHHGFDSIPEGMMWAADTILGGNIVGNDPVTTGGHLTTLLARFVGLALLGVLVAVMGDLMRSLLFGSTPAKAKTGRRKR